MTVAVVGMLEEINRLDDYKHCFLPGCDVQDKVTGCSW